MAKEKRSISLLEQALSLGQNGGIYYAGARVAPEEKQAVLFVGLGGSGADALIRIKDQITNRMILPTDESNTPIADTPKISVFWRSIRIKRLRTWHMVLRILTNVVQSSVIFP